MHSKIFSAVLTALLCAPVSAQLPQKPLDEVVRDLANQVARLQAQVDGLSARLDRVEDNPALLMGPFVSVRLDEIAGVPGPHVLLTGANLHLRSGTGTTDDMPFFGAPLQGLGNLIVGYNETPDAGLARGDRHGSHNIVVGRGHAFSSYGGLVAGEQNAVRAPCSTVSGGMANVASGVGSTVAGGQGNAATAGCASVVGGKDNVAEAANASVAGGLGNVASGGGASITGGQENTASGSCASVQGGQMNVASGLNASVAGGSSNVAAGERSSVSGGTSRGARGPDDWAAGTLFEDA